MSAEAEDRRRERPAAVRHYAVGEQSRILQEDGSAILQENGSDYLRTEAPTANVRIR